MKHITINIHVLILCNENNQMNNYTCLVQFIIPPYDLIFLLELKIKDRWYKQKNRCLDWYIFFDIYSL
jgi:hypothetical protein